MVPMSVREWMFVNEICTCHVNASDNVAAAGKKVVSMNEINGIMSVREWMFVDEIGICDVNASDKWPLFLLQEEESYVWMKYMVRMNLGEWRLYTNPPRLPRDKV